MAEWGDDDGDSLVRSRIDAGLSLLRRRDPQAAHLLAERIRRDIEAGADEATTLDRATLAIAGQLWLTTDGTEFQPRTGRRRLLDGTTASTFKRFMRRETIAGTSVKVAVTEFLKANPWCHVEHGKLVKWWDNRRES